MASGRRSLTRGKILPKQIDVDDIVTTSLPSFASLTDVVTSNIARYLNQEDIIPLIQSSKFGLAAYSTSPVMNVVWTSPNDAPNMYMSYFQKKYVTKVNVTTGISPDIRIYEVPQGTPKVQELRVKGNLWVTDIWSRVQELRVKGNLWVTDIWSRVFTYPNLRFLEIIGEDVAGLTIGSAIMALTPETMLQFQLSMTSLETLRIITDITKQYLTPPSIVRVLPRTLTSLTLISSYKEIDDKDYDCAGLWPPYLTELFCPAMTSTWEYMDYLRVLGHTFVGTLSRRLITYTYIQVEQIPNKIPDNVSTVPISYPPSLLALHMQYSLSPLPSSLTKLKIENLHNALDLSQLHDLKIIEFYETTLGSVYETLLSLSPRSLLTKVQIETDSMDYLHYMNMLPSSVESLFLHPTYDHIYDTKKITVPNRIPKFVNNLKSFDVQVGLESASKWILNLAQLAQNLQKLSIAIFEDIDWLREKLPFLTDLEIDYYGITLPLKLLLNLPKSLLKFVLLFSVEEDDTNREKLKFSNKELELVLAALPRNIIEASMPFKVPKDMLHLLPQHIQVNFEIYGQWEYEDTGFSEAELIDHNLKWASGRFEEIGV